MSLASVDHLVIAAHTLAQGVAWCEATLGVTPGPGGKHTLFGTHNRLLKISSEAFPETYLEIIAIDPEPDPDAAPARRPRWFGLDGTALQARLREAPRLIHFVARSTVIDMHRWGLLGLKLKPGDPVRMSRQAPEGLLTWQILVNPDGALDCAGALPTLIQRDSPNPATTMPDSGVTLRALQLHGLPSRARGVLGLRGVAVSAEPGTPLRAVLDTPLGEVALVSDA